MNKNNLIKTFANKFLADTADTITLDVLHNNTECIEKFLNDLEPSDIKRGLLASMGIKLVNAEILLTSILSWDMLSPLMVGDADETKKNYELELQAIISATHQIAYILSNEEVYTPTGGTTITTKTEIIN